MMSGSPARVLFDLPHPSHVHLFKHAIGELRADGCEVRVTAGPSSMARHLLDAADIEFRSLTTPWHSKLLGVPNWAVREYKLVQIAREFDPDIVLSHMNPAAAHAAHISDAQCIIFNDNVLAMGEVGNLAHPFATLVCTPAEIDTNLGPRQRRHDSYHELAYLHPNWFEPRAEVLHAHGIDPSDPYFVLRFRGDTQDNRPSFSEEARRELVESLAELGAVYAHSDTPLPTSTAAQELPVPPEDIHHLLAHANLFVGDTRTMALEAGMLGTPTVRYNHVDITEKEPHLATLHAKYSLVLSFDSESTAVVTAKNLARDPKAQDRWIDRREDLLDEKSDLTSFMITLVQQQATDVHQHDHEIPWTHSYELA